METETGERGIRARADLVTAVILVVIGLFVFYSSYTMPRLEARGVHPSTIPGLVPMVLGFALTVLGALLGINAWRARSGTWGDLFHLFGSMQVARIIAALALVFVYTLVLVGWLPFWAASMTFIFAFIVTMEVVLTREPVPLARSAFWALATAVVCGGGIYYLFARIFLVRLP